MSDTRPTLTAEEFQRRAAHRHPDWWVVGEELAFAPEVCAVEGWSKLGSSGFLSLTRTQRDLLIWIEFVRNATDGISGFFDDQRSAVAATEDVISRIGWPELLRAYAAAANAYMNINGKPVTAEQWLQEEKDTWERLRENARLFQRKHGHEPATGEALDRAVMRMQFLGLIPMRPSPSYKAVDDFDEWFNSEAAKVASERYITAFICRHRDELARVVTD